MLQLTLAPLDEFNTFALKHPSGSFYQEGAMATFRRELGWDTHPLFLKEGSKILGAFILAGKRGRYEIAMGPLLDFTDTKTVATFLKLVAEYVKNIGGSAISVYPNSVYQLRDSSGAIKSGPHTEVLHLFEQAGWKHKGFTTEYDFTSFRWFFVKDLSAIHNEDELLASYRQTTRQTVRKLNTEDYSIKKLTYEELPIIKQLIDSSNDRNDVHNRPLAYYQKFYKAFGDKIEFLVVYHKGKTPISAGVFVSHPNELAYFLSGTDSQYRHLYGGHFLQHHVMKRAVKDGVKRYNFFGIKGQFTKNPLLVYKSGFRGVIEEHVGGFTKIVNPTKYYTRKAMRIPKAVVNRLLK